MLSTFAFGEAPFCVDDASISVVQNVDGTAAISFGASATALKLLVLSGAASVTVTTTSASDRIRLVSAAASTAVTAANAFSRMRGVDASVEIVTTVNGQAVGVFVTSGGVSFALNQVCLAQILGDAWTEVAEGTETWADQTASGTWGTQSKGIGTWTDISENSVTWTGVNDGGEEWLVQ